MDFEVLLNISWIATIAAFIILFFIPSKLKSYVAAITVIVNAAITSWLAFSVLGGNGIELFIRGNNFFGDIPIRIDGLSAWFILIINFTSITGVIYGIGYLKYEESTPQNLTLHWFVYILFHLSMVWVCMVQHGLVFLIAWEIMSLTSMLLVIFDHNNAETIKAGISYLIQMHLSILFLTIGFIWLYSRTGSYDFNAFMTYFGSNSNIGLFLVFFVGFGVKAGFIPLHSGLLFGDPAAPSHISGVMSGILVKLGIYGIFRVASFIQSDFTTIVGVIITVSAFSGLYGILNAAVHRDFKKMLAYCTIENIGVIGIGIGVGLIGIESQVPMLYYLGFGGALLHVLNHSLFKSLLFYSTGSVCQQTNTRNMEKLGGLIKHMPHTAVIFLIGAIAIGGIPPFNGFISEFLIYVGLIEGIKMQNMSEIILLVLTLAGMGIIGGLSILTFTKAFGTIFLGNPRQSLPQEPKEVSSLMLFPQYLIISVMLSVSIFPQGYLKVIGHILSGLTHRTFLPQLDGVWDSVSVAQSISLCSMLLIVIVAAIWGIRTYVLRSKAHSIQTTWGCAYTAPDVKMQYTGKSFSKTLSKTFNLIVIEQKQYEEIKPGEIFPETRKYASHYHDFFEFRLIHVITNQLIYAVNYFKFIQNGRVQSYVLYGIAFILAIFVLTVFNFIS